MRILLWHGYLLGGTGSNVYTRALAREWSNAGHEVVVVSQEPHPEQYDLGGARTCGRRSAALLPVFVLDRYEGLEREAAAGPDARGARALRRANAAALRAALPADLVFANHVLLGGPVGGGDRRALRGQGARLRARVRDARQPGARGVGEGVARGAEAVFVGSEHIREVLEDVAGHVYRVHVVPPGVDVDAFRPAPARGGTPRAA